MRYRILSLALIVVFTFTLIGCNKQTTPITDTTSFINALKKEGLKVQISEPSDNLTTYVQRYVNEYRRMLGYYGGAYKDTVDIDWVKQENQRVNDLEVSSKNILKKSTFLKVIDEEIYLTINEYTSEDTADFDWQHIGVCYYISGPPSKFHGGILTEDAPFPEVNDYYKHNSLIVKQTTLDTYTKKSTVHDALNELIGPTYHTAEDRVIKPGDPSAYEILMIYNY